MTIGRKLYNGIDAFNEGMEKSQNIFNSIANRRNQEGTLAINQAAQQRAQTILPYLLQQYKDTHESQPLKKQLLAAQIQEAVANANEKTSNINFNNMFNNAVNGGNTASNQVGSPSQSENVITANSPQTPTSSPLPQEATHEPNPNAMNMSKSDVVAQANADHAANDNAMGVVARQPKSSTISTIPGTKVTPSQPTINPSNIAPTSFPGEEKQNNDPLNQPWNGKPSEVVVKEAGNPRAYAFDKMAGGTIAGRHYEPIKRETVDGIETVTYPISGKVTQQKVGPSAQEKSDITENAKVSASERMKDKTASDKIEESTRAIMDSAKLLNELDELFSKNKNSSGWMPGLAAKFHASKNLDTGDIVSKTKDLQGSFAKAESSRPGIGMVKFYEAAKPDIFNQPDYNKGQLHALAEKAKNTFESGKEEWERKNPGKKFPYKLPELKSLKSKNRHSRWNPETGRPEPIE